MEDLEIEIQNIKIKLMIKAIWIGIIISSIFGFWILWELGQIVKLLQMILIKI